jgi:hypothetical protein
MGWVSGMLSKISRVLLFLLSYLPLFLIYAINGVIHGEFVVFYSFLVVIVVVSILCLLMFRSLKKRGKRRSLIVESHELVNNMLIEYIFVYIFPFISAFDKREIVSFLILFVIIGSIYIKSDLIAVNPTLSLLGYSIYKVSYRYEDDVSHVREGYLISRGLDDVGVKVEMSKGVFIHFRSKKK